MAILIKNGTLIPLDSKRRIIEDGAVVIEKDKILDIGRTSEIEDKYSYNKVIDATRKVVLPGLMDGHAHAGHSLLRSLGMHNETWYKACEIIYAEGSSKSFWETDALHLNLERLRFGTTCGVTFFGGGESIMRVDDPKYAKGHCDAVEKIGIRTFLAIGPRKPPFPSKYSEWNGTARRDYRVSFEEQIEVCSSIVDRNHGRANGRINIAMMFPTPHPEQKLIVGTELEDLMYMSKTVMDLRREEDLLFSMDGHTRGTIEFCYEKLGLLGPRALFSHSTELKSEEIRICAETGTNITHNPSAVASMMGRCPVTELLDAGVTVVMGSDAGAPDRSFDMFRHMFQCGRYHRRYYRDARVLPPGKLLEMTTIDGAKAFGIADMIGSLEPGKKADIILLDIYKPHLYPFNLPVDRVTCFANGNDVETVIVDGNILMEGYEVKTIDEAEVLDKVAEEIEIVVGRSGLQELFEITDKYWGHSRY